MACPCRGPPARLMRTRRPGSRPLPSDIGSWHSVPRTTWCVVWHSPPACQEGLTPVSVQWTRHRYNQRSRDRPERCPDPCPRPDQALRRSPRSTASTSTWHAGEAFGFLGPNGAGKTSTMRMIALLAADHRRRADRARHGPGRDGTRIKARARRRAPDRHARHGADRPREPADLRPLLRHARRRGAGRGRRSCSTSSSSPSGPTTWSSRCPAA